METMITLAGKEDEEELFQYLGKDNPWTVFFYGDYHTFGINSKIAKFYISRTNGEISFVYLFYRNTLVSFYSQDEDYPLGAAEAFLSGKKVSVLSGKESLVSRLLPVLPGKSLQSCYLAVLESTPAMDRNLPSGMSLRELATEEDFRKLDKLVDSIEEFAASREASRKPYSQYLVEKKGGCHFLGVFSKEGKLLATASSSADNDVSAMVVSVCTDKDFRGKGLATFAIRKLAEIEFSSGKKYLTLFYDNPEAGKIYRKAGFLEIGKYAMIH